MKMLISLLILCFTLLSANSVKDVKYDQSLINSYYKKINNMSEKQLEILRKVYIVFKQHDLEYTGVAICIHESVAGKYLFNPVTGDYGIMGINLKTYMRANDIKSSYYKDIEIASILMYNELTNMYASIDNLKFWKKKYDNNWLKIWGSYNGGYNINYRYSHKIFNIIMAFKKYMKTHKHFISPLNKYGA